MLERTPVGVDDGGLKSGAWALCKGSAGVADLDISHAFLSKDVLLYRAHNGYHPVGIKGKSLGGQYFAKAKRKKNYVEATFSDATSAAGVSNNMGRLSGNQTRAVQPVLGRDKARPPGPTKDDALRGGLRRSMFRGWIKNKLSFSIAERTHCMQEMSLFPAKGQLLAVTRFSVGAL